MEHNYKLMSKLGSKEGEPFTPQQAKESKINNLHPEMINVVNDLLSSKYRDKGKITIAQKDIIKNFLAKVPDMTHDRVFKEKHLDIEPVFEKAGWRVTYDKPGYNESGDSYFHFEKKD